MPLLLLDKQAHVDNEDAGDIDVEETKKLVEKWFGEIPSGPEVEKLIAQPVYLGETKSLYFEERPNVPCFTSFSEFICMKMNRSN